jgi:hypothetical protein
MQCPVLLGFAPFQSKRESSAQSRAHAGAGDTVDRQYFETAEGAHRTNVVKVTVDTITCVDGAYANSPPPAAAASARSAGLLR